MNVVGLMVIMLSIIPVYLANRLSQDPIGVGGGQAPAGGAAAARRGSRANDGTRGGPDGLSPRFTRCPAEGKDSTRTASVTDPLHRCRSPEPARRRKLGVHGVRICYTQT